MKKTKTKTPKTPAVVETYETEIEFDCPIRGKVKQKVKIKRYASVEAPPSVVEIVPKLSITEELDRKHPGLILVDDSIDEEQEDEVI